MNYPRKNPIYLRQVHRFAIRKSEIFTTFEKTHLSFINTLKSEETKSQLKAYFSYLDNSYFDNYKTSPCTLRQYRVSRNLR